MLADPFSFEAETFIKGLDRIYPLAPKIGGLASGARQVGGTALYLGNQVYHSGCITLALTGNIDIDMVVAQGCRPIGDPMFVTLGAREPDPRARRPRAARCAVGAVRAPARARSRAVQPIAAPRHGDARRRQRVHAGRFPDPQHPRHGPAKRRAVGQRQCAGEQRGAISSARCRHFGHRSGAHADAATKLAPGHARRRRAAVLLLTAAASGCTARPITTATPSAAWSADVPIGGFFCNGEIGPIQNATFLHGYTSAFAVFQEKK